MAPPPQEEKKEKLGVSSWNNPRNGIFLGPLPIRGSCSLGERGTVKVVGRVRREAIVYHRPKW